MALAIIYVACAVLVVVPLYFIFHSVYRDGVLGRIALSAISFNAAGILVEGPLKELLLGKETDWSLMWTFGAAMVVAFAVFICWHLFRFHSRVVRAQGVKPCGIADQPGCPYITGAPVPAMVPVGRRASDRTFSLRRRNTA